MDATKYSRTMLKNVKGLNLANYPDIRRPDLDLLIIATITRAAKAKKVELEFRQGKSDEFLSQFSIYCYRDNDDNVGVWIGNIYAQAARWGDHWYLLNVIPNQESISVTIKYPDDHPKTVQGRVSRSWGTLETAINGPEVKSWAAAVVAKANEYKATAPKRRRIP